MWNHNRNHSCCKGRATRIGRRRKKHIRKSDHSSLQVSGWVKKREGAWETHPVYPFRPPKLIGCKKYVLHHNHCCGPKTHKKEQSQSSGWRKSNSLSEWKREKEAGKHIQTPQKLIGCKNIRKSYHSSLQVSVWVKKREGGRGWCMGNTHNPSSPSHLQWACTQCWIVNTTESTIHSANCTLQVSAHSAF